MRHPPLQAPLLWQAYLGFWIAGVAAAPWPLPAAVCALLLFWADDRLWRRPRALLALCCLLAGLLTAQWLLFGAPLRTALPSPDAADMPAPGRLCGAVRDVRGLPDNRLRILLAEVRPAAEHDEAAGSGPSLPGLALWTWEAPASGIPLPGQTVCLSRRLLPAAGFVNEDLPDWGLRSAAQGVRRRLWSRGDAGAPRVYGTPTLSARWRETLRQDFLRVLHPAGARAGESSPEQLRQDTSRVTAATLAQGKAILPALLFGDRRYLRQETLDNFAAAALAHSLALSGQHLAVAGLAGLLCILAVARLRPGFYLRRPRMVLTLTASLPPALLYLWLGNAPASLLRAAVMLAALAILVLRGSPHTTLDALCAALLCIVVAAPLSVLDTGLQLSALCVATIGLSLPWLRCCDPFSGSAADRAAERGPAAPPGRLRRILRALLRILLISLVIQTALLPVSLLLFGNMGHWFALNVLWLPTADMLVLPAAALGLLLAALGLDIPARLALELAAMPCQWLVDGLTWLDSVGWLQSPALLRPHWTSLPAYAALLTALAARAGRTAFPPAARRLLTAGVLLLCVGPLLRTADRLSGAIRLDVLDVGQSQALALRLPGHARLLLDGGGSASPRFDPGRMLTGPALTRNDAPRLAAVLNSHPDLDHMGGLLYIMRHFDVAHLLDNGRDGKGESGRQWAELRRRHHARPLRRGDVLLTDDPQLRLEILHPPADEGDAWKGNNASVVARLVRGGRGLALFMGDAERPVLRRLLDNGDDLQAEVLIAPHHGSRTGFLQEFYEAVRPGLVVASCGTANRYGYPAKQLRAWLAARDIPLVYTGRDGETRITWSGGNFTWRTARMNRSAAAPRPCAMPPRSGTE